MFDVRPIQTKVKHIILEKYLKAWGGIIMGGAKKSIYDARQRGKSAGLHFIYVDCFAGYGRYVGELEDKERGKPLTPVFGSPIIGVQALDSLVDSGRRAGISIRTNTILIEADSEVFGGLRTSLEVAGLSSRVHQTDNFQSLNANEIAIVRADSTHMISELLDYTTRKYAFAFYFLDPYGPTGIPLTNVAQIISQPKHDVLINMPYQDLHKKSGILRKIQLSQAEAALLQNYDKMFGNSIWRSIAASLMDIPPGSKRSEELELELASHYRDTLRSTDPGLSIKSLPLRFSDKERTMFHLYLTTHDPTGSIQMNQIIHDAGYVEHHLRWKLKYLKMTYGGQQLSFLDQLTPPMQQQNRDYIKEIGDKITDAFSGRTTNQKEIYQLLADELYRPSEIRQTLTKLRKAGKVNFDPAVSRLRHSTPIKVS